MDLAEQDKAHIMFVLQWFKGAHVDDANAASAFENRTGVFDVTPQATKLEKFLKDHQWQNAVIRTPEGGLPCLGLLNHRPIYFAFKS